MPAARPSGSGMSLRGRQLPGTDAGGEVETQPSTGAPSLGKALLVYLDFRGIDCDDIARKRQKNTRKAPSAPKTTKASSSRSGRRAPTAAAAAKLGHDSLQSSLTTIATQSTESVVADSGAKTQSVNTQPQATNPKSQPLRRSIIAVS